MVYDITWRQSPFPPPQITTKLNFASRGVFIKKTQSRKALFTIVELGPTSQIAQKQKHQSFKAQFSLYVEQTLT